MDSLDPVLDPNADATGETTPAGRRNAVHGVAVIVVQSVQTSAKPS
jgi:hypothetical protein